MRSRNVKPGFFTNEQLAEVGIPARLLFVGLWMMADREGRLEYRPKRIKMQVFPGDSVDVEPMLHDLQGQTLIVMYEVKGNTYIWIPGFAKHQKPHPKEVPSTLPPYPGGSQPPIGGGVNPSDVLNPDVLSSRGIEQPAAVLTLASASGDANSGRSPFEKFWERYPKKAKRKEARRVWLSKQLDGKADALIADVKRRLAEDRRWLAGYVPDPPTYLRGERWNDAIEPVPVHKNGHASIADELSKQRGQILELAKMFKLEQGDDDWPTFAKRVTERNEQRLRSMRA
jgi:hypothetical protein